VIKHAISAFTSVALLASLASAGSAADDYSKFSLAKDAAGKDATTTLTVSATQRTPCTVTAPKSVEFGTHDYEGNGNSPLANNFSAQGRIHITCGDETGYITLSQGSNYHDGMRSMTTTSYIDADEQYLKYTLTQPSGSGASATDTGTCWGDFTTPGCGPLKFTSDVLGSTSTEQDFTVFGNVNGTGQDAKDGQKYTDTVVASVYL